MELLQRASVAESERTPCLLGDQRLPREDAIALFERTLEALDFFEPHFQTYDDLIVEARRSWWYRLFNNAKVDGMIKLRSLRRSFSHYRDVVTRMQTEFVVLDPKLTSAADGWIAWHELEKRRVSKGPYR